MVCLTANSEEFTNVIMEKVNKRILEYGLNVNGKESTVLCVNGEVGRRKWKMENCYIGELEE